MCRRLSACVFAAVAVHSSASAEDRFVFAKSPGTHLKAGNGASGRFYYEGRVLSERDGALLIIHESGATGPVVGWVAADDTVAADKAVAYFTRRIKEEPKDAWSYVCRGRAWLLRKDSEVALQDFDRAVELSPTAWARTMRGDARFVVGAIDEAQADYDEALRIDPSHFSAYCNRGRLSASVNNTDAALKDYDRAIAVEPSFALALVRRGNLHQTMKRYDSAARDYEAALRIDPINPVAWYNRGTLKAARGDHAEAVADYSQALSVDSRFVAALFNRGNSRRVLGQLPSAKDDYDCVLAILPTYVPALTARASIRRRTRDFSGALSDLQSAMKIDSKNFDVLAQTAWVHCEISNPRRDSKLAVEAAKTLVSAAGKSVTCDQLALLAAAHASAGSFSEALKAQSEAVALATGESRKAMELALEHYRNGKLAWSGSK